MTQPWQTLFTVSAKEGRLELRKRGAAEFLIMIDGRVLMTSVFRRSEEALATLGCAHLSAQRTPRVLVGGLGMGFTLRATLSALSKSARVDVAELSPEVVDWCRGPLAVLTDSAISDPRVHVQITDVAKLIAMSPAATYDAILLDLYEGPHEATQRPNDPFYGAAALSRTRHALKPGGAFAVWSEEPDTTFPRRLSAAGFEVSRHREGHGGRAHYVYLGISKR